MKHTRFVILILLVLSVRVGIQSRVCFAQDTASAPARKVISKVAPVYPQVARTMKLSGTVKLEVVVQASGTVKSLQVKGGSPVLAQSAQNAIHAWKWEKTDHDTTEQVEFHFDP